MAPLLAALSLRNGKTNLYYNLSFPIQDWHSLHTSFFRLKSFQNPTEFQHKKYEYIQVTIQNETSLARIYSKIATATNTPTLEKNRNLIKQANFSRSFIFPFPVTPQRNLSDFVRRLKSKETIKNILEEDFHPKFIEFFEFEKDLFYFKKYSSIKFRVPKVKILFYANGFTITSADFHQFSLGKKIMEKLISNYSTEEAAINLTSLSPLYRDFILENVAKSDPKWGYNLFYDNTENRILYLYGSAIKPDDKLKFTRLIDEIKRNSKSIIVNLNDTVHNYINDFGLFSSLNYNEKENGDNIINTEDGKVDIKSRSNKKIEIFGWNYLINILEEILSNSNIINKNKESIDYHHTSKGFFYYLKDFLLTTTPPKISMKYLPKIEHQRNNLIFQSKDIDKLLSFKNSLVDFNNRFNDQINVGFFEYFPTQICGTVSINKIFVCFLFINYFFIYF